MNYAILDASGTAVNVIALAEGSDWRPPAGHSLVPVTGGAGLGWTYRDQQWSPPVAPELPTQPISVPRSVTPLQARKVLLAEGLLDSVEAMMANPATDRTVRMAWEYATEWQRADPYIIAIATALGLDEAALDRFFIAAAKL